MSFQVFRHPYIYFLATIFGFGLSYLPAQSQPLDNLFNSELIHNVSDSDYSQTANHRSPTGWPCFEHDFLIRTKHFKPEFFLTYPLTIESKDCAIRAPYGLFADGYVHMNGHPTAGKVVDNNNYIALANNNALFVTRRSGNQHNLYVSPEFGQQTEPNLFDDYHVTYSFPGGIDHPVLNDYGAPLSIAPSTIRASKNSQWLLAWVPNLGSARINVETLEVTLFGDQAQPYAASISNDGSIAALYYGQSKRVVLYDLNNCISNGKAKAKNCTSRELTNEITSAINNFEEIRYFEFQDNNLLNTFVDHYDEIGLHKTVRVQTHPEGYEIAQRSYLAMGDSFSSGEGELEWRYYELGTDVDNNKCHLSQRSYPYLLASEMNTDQFYSVACSGARTWHVNHTAQYKEKVETNLEEWHPGRFPQSSYLDYGQSAVLTLSIGGNDVGFGDKLKECVIGPGTCKYAESSEHRSDSAVEIARMYHTLTNVYSELVAQTQYQTKLYVVGYPQFVRAVGGSCGLNVHLNDGERQFVGQAVTYLNQVIKAAASSSGIHYLDIDDALEGRNLCSFVDDSQMAVNGLTVGNDTLGIIGAESYHPNANGHQLMYQKIMGLAGGDLFDFTTCSIGSDTICPAQTDIPLPNSEYWGGQASSTVQTMNQQNSVFVANNTPQHKSIIASSTTKPSRNINLKAANLKPSQTVEVRINSSDLYVTHVQVDEQGVVDTELQIPDSVQPGYHTVYIIGQDFTETEVNYYQGVLIPGEEGDIDGDGITDDEDLCQFVEPAMRDLDGDGQDDACDSFVVAQEPHESAQNNQTNNNEDENTTTETAPESSHSVLTATNSNINSDPVSSQGLSNDNHNPSSNNSTQTVSYVQSAIDQETYLPDTEPEVLSANRDQEIEVESVFTNNARAEYTSLDFHEYFLNRNLLIVCVGLIIFGLLAILALRHKEED